MREGSVVDPGIRRGALQALAAAALFGASTPFAKLLIDAVDPWLLAGLLYLGSGLGLLALQMARRAWTGRQPGDAPRMSGSDGAWLGAAILAGGVVAPVLLVAGLVRSTASAAALLLNLEGVLTALLAWFVFRENFDRRIGLGMLSIAGGAVLLAWPEEMSPGGLLGSALVVGACLCWAIDNNLTRKVALSDPALIALLKGIVAGTINLILALAQGAPWPAIGTLLGAGAIGLLGYGVSLVLFVLALRHLGTARTGAYFSTAPFVGAAIGVLLLREPLSWPLLAAGALMAFGVWLHLTERHEHEHEHEPMMHSHRHRHDLHHQHGHGPQDPPAEPHTHVHAHARLRHSHVHVPDAHHRHRH